MLRLSEKRSVIVLRPKELTELIVSRPGICPTSLSRGAVTEEATTSGLAPGSVVMTSMVGKSTAGKAATGSNR